MSNRTLRRALVALLLSAPLHAQTGVLDQFSLPPGPSSPGCGSVGYAASAGFIWQAGVQAGMSGQLEGVDVFMYGFTNTTVGVQIRKGVGWTTQPVLASSTATYLGTQRIYVDFSAANIQLTAGEYFVIEFVGMGTSAGLEGTNCATPNYPEPIWVKAGSSAPATHPNPNYRLGFSTYMLPASPGIEFCFGTGCPCGNDDPAAGCANSLGSGAHLGVAAGSASIASDDLDLQTTGLPTTVNGIVFMGGTQQSTPFGDGIRCAGGPTKRFGIQSSGATGTMGISGPVGLKPGVITSGSTWIFQTWYRNPPGPCGKGTNLSNAVLVDFVP